MILSENKMAIIEIIKNSMNKELSEGCLVEYKNRHSQIIIEKLDGRHQVYTDGFYEHVITGVHWVEIMDDDRKLSEFQNIKYVPINIIGHYDISAVLKYVSGRMFKFNIFPDYIEIYFQDTKIGEISSKPLYLYNTDDEKQLLSVLQKLK